MTLCFVLAPFAHAKQDDKPTRLLPLPSPTEGLSFYLGWDADLFYVADGGVKRGYATDSLISAGLGLDTDALGWWQGGQFAFGVQAIASTHPSRYAGDLQALSNIAGPNRRQVSELWYSQAFGQSVLLRAGIMDLNRFFDVNDTATLFINSSYGITPTIPSNVPTATYPDSAWGLMARFGTQQSAWRVGLFQGDPVDRSSALERGAMLIAERDWIASNNGTRIGIGAWYRHAPSVAPPTSDWGAYANLEQSLPDNPNTILFGQLGISPGEANTVPVYLGGGIRFTNVSGAISDFGVGFARAWIRNHAAETSVEVTATIPLFDGAALLQPDLQYILHPSGIYPNALVIGLRLHAAIY
ncbi:MAG: carbohydrate porin [Gammaproteobacteria bacterium]|nr:carbohydrate porin [Gammaproteobacteria bacterium]